MRVLQVDSGRAWRGGQNQVWLLCRELLRQAYVEQALVTKHGSELAQRAAAAGVTVLGTAWDIGLDPRAGWHLRRTSRAFQPGIGHGDRVDALIAAASVFMLCSRREGLGSVILNALALNRPDVATAAGGVPEILPPESLVPVEAAEALAQKVAKMLEHPATIPLP